MKRGFTLIELMVVLSIISLLASVVVASLSSTKVEARNTAREFQVGQIQKAVILYTDEYGHAPDLQGTCNASGNGNIASCVARSTAGDSNPAQQAAWNTFIDEIEPYLSTFPPDPCGTAGCTDDAGNPTGYVYVAPKAMLELCGQNCPYTLDEIKEWYQLFSVLERTSTRHGSSSNGPFYDPFAPPPASAPTITSVTPVEGTGNLVTVSGTGFSTTNNTVKIKLTSGETILSTLTGLPGTETSITFSTSDLAASISNPIIVHVQVSTASGESNWSGPFTIYPYNNS